MARQIQQTSLWNKPCPANPLNTSGQLAERWMVVAAHYTVLEAHYTVVAAHCTQPSGDVTASVQLCGCHQTLYLSACFASLFPFIICRFLSCSLLLLIHQLVGCSAKFIEIGVVCQGWMILNGWIRFWVLYIFTVLRGTVGNHICPTVKIMFMTFRKWPCLTESNCVNKLLSRN